MWHIPYTIPLSHSCMHPWPASRPQGAGGQCTMLPPTNLGLASFRTDPEIGRDGSPDQTPHMPVSIGPFVPRARQAGGVWRPALGACHLARRHTFCRPPATPPVPPTGGPRPGMSITSCGARRVDRVLTAAEDSSAWRARWLLPEAWMQARPARAFQQQTTYILLPGPRPINQQVDRVSKVL